MDPLNALGPCVEVVKSAWGPVSRWINYARKLESKVNILTVKNHQLTANETDIRRKIERSQRQGKMVSESAVMLLEDVMKVQVQVSEIASSLEKNRSCFFNLCFRLKLTKHVIKVIQEVDRLLGKLSLFANELVVEQSPPRVLPLPAPPLVGKSTVNKNLDEIMECLRNPMIHKIGVYGMGGSGKTTTIMNINNQLANTDDFDKVIWVTVSKDVNLDKVQGEISQQLSLDLSNYVDEVPRASRLSERLKQANRFLIIFDDMWDWVSLEKVGIPEPNGENRCKILLTSRSLAVCRDMETDIDIKLELLSKEEAWELFVNKAGSHVLCPELQPIAETVVRKCDGLPLGIITVGRALRREVNVRVWRNAVKYLRFSPTKIRGMEDEVFKLLRFSYSRLKNDTLRKCFLYAALFPEDYLIENNELIKYWIVENMIHEVGDLETEIDEGFNILKDLVDACMFEESEEGYRKGIRVHDSLRDLAINIMEEEGGVIVKAGLGLIESPNRNEWEKAGKISLMGNRIVVLHDQPDCPNLSTLLLRGNPLSEKISFSFFNQMSALQTLDISYTNVSELPSSLSNLLNLRALFLQGNDGLKKIPSVVNLKKLQVLNLSGTSIEEFPQGMEGLLSLRSLNLTHTTYLKKYTTPKLAYLEELHLDGSSVFWKMDSPSVVKCMEDMRYLNRLTIFTITMRLEDYFHAFKWLQWDVFKDFHFKIYPPEMIDEEKRPEPKSVHIHDKELYNHCSVLLLPPSTQELLIFGSRIPRLSTLLCLRNLKFLNKCRIVDCSLMSGDCLMLGNEMEEYTFRSLEYLSLGNIRGLTGFYDGEGSLACLANLRVLDIGGCDSLINLFCPNVLPLLHNIEIIEVKGCPRLKNIVAGSKEDDSAITITTNTARIILPRLHTLKLGNLRALQSISRATWVCLSLRHFRVFQCPKVKYLPFSVGSLSNLQKIEGKLEWWDALEWDDINTRSLLNPRFQHIRNWY